MRTSSLLFALFAALAAVNAAPQGPTNAPAPKASAPAPPQATAPATATATAPAPAPPAQKTGAPLPPPSQATAAPVPPPAPKGAPAGAQTYPNMPTVFPDVDQQKMITGALLQAPLIVEGMKQVQAKAPARLLNLPVAEYVGTASPKYAGNPAENCYWPAGQCVRAQATADYNADVVTCPQANTWGMTYDDGPTVAPDGIFDTGDVRTALAAINAKATFFVAGANAVQYPQEVKATFDAGHEIAVHTWTHHPLTSLTNEQIVAELLYTEALVFQATGVKPRFYRPPYGDVDDRVRAVASALGYTNIMWTTAPADRDTHDTEGPVGGVVDRVRTWHQAQPGFVALEHDITPQTSEIAVRVLQDIQRAGAAFPLKIQAVGQCLGVSPYVGGAGANPSTPATPTVTNTVVVDGPRPTTGPGVGSGPTPPSGNGGTNASGQGNLSGAESLRAWGSLSALAAMAVGALVM